MRQSTWDRSAPARRVLARACRARAAAEPAEQALDVPWKVVAALLEAPGAAGAHEQAERDLLISFLEGPARVQFRGRWLLATRALGQSGHPDALASLRRMADRLATSQDPTDRHDRAALLLGRVAGGDWEGELALRAVLLEGHEELRRLTSHAVGILAERALAGDERARRWLEEVWAGPAAENSAVREIVASALLGDAPPVTAPAWVEPMVQDLERPRTPPAYHVHALVHRLRQGQAAARSALLAWLVREAGEGVLEGADPERSTIPALIALRALDRAP
jgi:hypothetical protein